MSDHQSPCGMTIPRSVGKTRRSKQPAACNAGTAVQHIGRTTRISLPALLLVATASSAVAQDVTTWHNNNARTGVQHEEKVLTPANVAAASFGKVFSLPVDGDIYAQSLYLSQQKMPDGQLHNLLIVATERDAVYAFDADGKNPAGGYLWKRSLLPSGETWLSDNDVNTTDIAPDIGITGTPVIDPASGTIFVVAKSKTTAATPTFFQRLHALNVADGTEKLNGPTAIAATASGTGDGGATVSFNPLLNNQRAALLLVGARDTPGGESVVITWSSHGDNGLYHGWVIAYDAKDISRQTGAWTDTPNGSQGGIWMSGGGLSADSSNNIFAADGNGTFDANTGGKDYGDSAFRLQLGKSGLTLADYFTPADQSSLNAVDNDMGTSAVLLLPRQKDPLPNLAVTSDKSGTIYLLNRDKMGGFTTPNDNSLQSFSNGNHGVHSSLAFFEKRLYGAFDGGPLETWDFDPELQQFVTPPESQSAATYGCSGCDGGGATPSISANGSANGIVWTLDNSGFGAAPAILHAYDPSNLAVEFFNSTQAANNRDNAAVAVKFTTPTIRNGLVYVGGRNAVTVFGLLSKGAPAATPVFSPKSGSYAGTQTVTLTDSTSNASIYYSLGGAAPVLYTSPFQVTATETVTADALVPGFSESPTATATYTIQPPPPPAGEVEVSLAKAANTVGIFTDGAVSTSPGLDGQGSAYSATVLGAYLRVGATQFLFGAPNQNDAITGGGIIALPAAKEKTLSFLGTGLNGNQPAQAFVVTYTDGTRRTFLQNMSDWFTPQSYPGETLAVAGAYRDSNNGTEDGRPFSLYAYSLSLDNTKTVKSLSVPSTPNVAVLALTLSSK